jgi:hypothetical protein
VIDPNKLLAKLRGGGKEKAAAFRELDAWLTAGGYLPSAWVENAAARPGRDLNQDPPSAAGSDTSAAAAASVKKKLGGLHRQIYKLVKERGLDGCTCDEVEQLLDLRHQTASARIRELRDKKKLIDTGRRRRTRSNRPAAVYIVPSAGRTPKNNRVLLLKKRIKQEYADATLIVELVPSSCWASNVRDHVTSSQWDIIRQATYLKADYLCEVCGSVGPKHPVECHEIWRYNDKKRVQKLVGLVALCPACHEVKHFGRASLNDRGDAALAHLCEINNWHPEDGNDYLDLVFRLWEKRSEHPWKLDLRFLKREFGLRVKSKRKVT